MTDYQATEQRVERRGNGHVRPERAQLFDLLSCFIEESRAMLLLEVKLAKREIAEKIAYVQSDAKTVTIGGLVVYAGMLALMFAGIAAMALVMDWWLSALIMGGAVTLIGAILLAAGKARFRKHGLDLTHTKESLREGKQWAKSQIPR